MTFLEFLEQNTSYCLDSRTDRENLAAAYQQQFSSNHQALVLNDLTSTCGGCPQSWEAKTTDNKEFYFRLRGGYWSIEINDVTLVSGTTDNGADGVCRWDDVIRWALQQGLAITVQSTAESTW